MLSEEQIRGKWNEIKGGVRNLWGEITDDELEQTKGNIQAVSGIVEQKYGETKESIKHKMDRLMDSFDNDTDKSLKLNDGEASYQRDPTAVRTRPADRGINTQQGFAGSSDHKSSSDGDRASLSAGTGTHKADKSELYGLDDVDSDMDDEYEQEEIFDDGDKENPKYEARQPGPDVEDRIARH